MIYLDYAATTKLSERALRAMLPFLRDQYANPSSSYRFSDAVREKMSETRKILADALGAKQNEIYFTSGGTESDNWALKEVMEQQKKRGKNHLITTQIEHHAVLHSCQWLENNDCEVTYLPLERDGIVRAEQVERAIRPNTALISVMAANNEIGTLQPLKEIGKIAKQQGILFHTDAVQAFGHIPISVEDCNLSLLSASAHKFHGPKGIGFLYVRENVELPSFLHGGGQEGGKRSGTENTAAIVGMGAAAAEMLEQQAERAKKEQALRDYLIESIQARIPYTKLNGDRKQRLPNNVNVSISFVEGEVVVLLMGMRGICVSAGSACSAGSAGASHVLRAIGLSEEEAHNALRLTLGAETTKQEIDETVEALSEIVSFLRGQSPMVY
ncbi:MAG: cysteine desulfurase family protein [bacterium]|nr:cysteine desulfurase family protein [bacterium]